MKSKPSATQVRGSVGTSGLIAALLAPWVHASLKYIEMSTGIQFDPGYEAQVLTAVGIGICYIGAHLKVREISNSPGGVTETERTE